MKTIGLIGGMSWESSLVYYKLINEAVKTTLGGLHSCKCIMNSFDFAEIENLQRKGDWEALEYIMSDAARSLEKAGVEFILICSNTMHKPINRMLEDIKIPLLHIADSAAEKIKASGVRKVGLLGTRFTMEEDFYIERLEKLHNIEVIVPSREDRQIVDDIIFKELVLGEVKQTSKEEYRRIIHELCRLGAEGIILGCTEIFLLIDSSEYDIEIFDTTIIHAEAAVEFALREKNKV